MYVYGKCIGVTIYCDSSAFSQALCCVSQEIKNDRHHGINVNHSCIQIALGFQMNADEFALAVILQVALQNSFKLHRIRVNLALKRQ